MSIATEIQRIAGNVSAAFTAVRGKGGTVSQANSDHLAAAIGTIPEPVTEAIAVTANGTYYPRSGIDGFDEVEVDVPDTPLPPLTNPATAGDIILHKEAIDGQGSKLTGTLDPLEDAELDPDSPPEIANGVLAIELVHGQDFVKELTYSVPDALPENIVSGKDILGVAGTAKKITVRSGTVTINSDTISISIPETSSLPKAFMCKATDFETLKTKASETLKPIYAVSMLTINDDYLKAQSAIARCPETSESLSAGLSLGLNAGINNTGKLHINAYGTPGSFIEGTYTWKVYDWEEKKEEDEDEI